MKNFKLILKILLPIVALICGFVFIPWDALRVFTSPQSTSIQKLIDKSVGYNLNGIIVYVDKKGSSPVLYASGIDNLQEKSPLQPQALFKIASISKLYIAAATSMLVANKTLNLDQSLDSQLPELKGKIANSNLITLKMLIQHRSGIPDFINSSDLHWENLSENTEDYLKLILNKPADFEPDSRYQYSNTNYLVLGAILDKKLGYSHHVFIKEEILDPLKLFNTFSYLKQADTSKLSSGYIKEYAGDLKMQNYIVPGGSMVSTAADVGVFLKALKEGTLLNKKEHAIYKSLYPFEHTGLLAGYSSIARYEKDIDAYIVVFANSSGGSSWSTLEVVYSKVQNILKSNP